MYRTKRLASVALGLVVLASLVAAGDALAQGTKSVQLTPSRDSGVSGTATLSEVEGGVRVTLNMRGLPEAGVKYITHIHGGGTCADERAGRTAPVTIPLNPVVAKEDGTGSAATTIEGVTLAELLSDGKQRFIGLHAKTKEGQGVPPNISCADLVLASASATIGNGGTTMMGGETTMGGYPLPVSGGPTLLLPAAALLLGSSVLVSAILCRRQQL